MLSSRRFYIAQTQRRIFCEGQPDNKRALIENFGHCPKKLSFRPKCLLLGHSFYKYTMKYRDKKIQAAS